MKRGVLASRRVVERPWALFASAVFVAGGLFATTELWLPAVFSSRYDAQPAGPSLGGELEKKWVATHLPTPKPLKAIYLTSFVAGNKERRGELVRLVDETELNAVVIDIKDYTGRIAFPVEDPLLVSYGASEARIPDVKEFIEDLHRRGIYVIGRISVFQDLHFVSQRPDLAVARERASSTVWRDHKGLTWLDAGAREVWEYIGALARESYRLGFDELNFDYIRFPSDGDMTDVLYPVSGRRVKAEVLRSFFAYLSGALGATGAVLSADLFGMTTTNPDDLNIGQILEHALPYFDYVAPMVYPSHYPPNFLGIKNPAAEPYRVIRYSLDRAFLRSSTTPDKIRPWLQDFHLGAAYTSEMIRSEMQAVYDAGFSSWMLWNPANRYTRGALLPEE